MKEGETTMLDKNKKKERKTWVGLYTRKTPTKRELEIKISRKNKQKGWD